MITVKPVLDTKIRKKDSSFIFIRLILRCVSIPNEAFQYMFKRKCWTAILFGMFLGFSIVQAQPNANGSTIRPQATARFADAAPVTDGNVLGEPFWQNIEPLSELWQIKPNYGNPASERTEIRIAHDQNNFYLSVVCFDAAPQQLVVSDARRDAPLDNTDSFIFILDTYNDGQNGFMFGTNSQGVEYDAQVDNEGQGNFNPNRQQSGTIGGFNLNWDASWTVIAEVGDYGWSAEFSIPLRTLRYRSGSNQTWGINFQRNIRKSNETVYWSNLPIGLDMKRLSLAGKLNGLNLRNPGNLKVIPYALGQVSRDFDAVPSETNSNFEMGGDVKYSVTPSLTLDLTYNTDFAQVEVDEQQVNLDRFNLFFPEKRPFFLENAGLFSVGSPGEVDLFFSRRIGIGNQGELVPIDGGARLSGKINRTNVGVLSMFTDQIEDSGINGNNFSVARVSHEFASRSAIGGIFVNRRGLGDAEDNDYNRTYALDGKIGLGNKAQMFGFVAKTQTDGIDEEDHAFKFKIEYKWDNWELATGYTQVGQGFNPEVGFLSRKNFRKPELRVLYHWRMNGKFGLLELRPHVTYRSFYNFNGFQETSFLHIDNHWEWQSGIEIHTGTNYTVEGVVDAFEISDGIFVPADTYKHQEAQFIIMTNQSKVFSFNTRHVYGGFFGGTRKANSGTVRIRLGDRFNSEFTYANNNIDLPVGDFTTNLFRARLAYSFTPSIFIQSLIQYNSVVDSWSTNVRFGWLQKANTGLFVVYNEIRDDIGIDQRSFIVKYSYLFDVLK